MTMENKLSLEGLIFQATKINVENNVLTITLNRPEKKNALNNVMMNEICYALSYAKQEREIRVVIIGAEGDGVSRSLLESCDDVCSIPIYGLVECLNVAVATGITLYQIKKLIKKTK